MAVSLDRLPFDVVFQISKSLHAEDVVHLGQTCRYMKALLDARTLHRSVVETLPHTDEARFARSGQITYKQALQAIYDRRNALSNAQPFSARILCQGSNFLSRQGFICVQAGDIIQIYNARTCSIQVQLDLNTIVRPILDSIIPSVGTLRISMLYYSDGILAVYAEVENRPNTGHIFAISTEHTPLNGRRVIRVIHVTSSSKLFVRHTARYLYYGTHTGIGDDGHHKWELSGISLDARFPLPKTERPLMLEDFHGTDIGSTVAFEIYNDHFHAVSNQGTFEVEEIDWTSFYHCVQFPLSNPTLAMLQKDERVYRRQHAQGPIHDSWTDLSLQISERTNKVMIVESRREWAQASSRQSRTFYTSHFRVKPKRSSRTSTPDEDSEEEPLLPQNDLYVSLLDSTNKPNYIQTPPQFAWSRHPEFTKDDLSPRSFILARTKFRAYNYSCHSFLDIVEDDKCCNDTSKPPCLRLRVGARREAYPDEGMTKVKGKQRADELDTFVDSHIMYRNSPIRMWPPPASRCPCAKRLHDIIDPPLSCAPSQARSIIGVLDERSLVYMVKPGRAYGATDDTTMGTIVVVDFTRPLISNGTTPSQLVGMARCDSMIDDDTSKEAADFDASCWQWTPKLKSFCQAGTCR